MSDIIDRQAAIATAISGRVRTLPTTEDGENWIRVNEVRDSLLSLKSAHLEPRWIPVTERLPETDEMMLVTCQPKKGLPNVNRAFYMDGSWHGSGSMSSVTAWMPLPEPYRKETLDV